MAQELDEGRKVNWVREVPIYATLFGLSYEWGQFQAYGPELFSVLSFDQHLILFLKFVPIVILLRLLDFGGGALSAVVSPKSSLGWGLIVYFAAGAWWVYLLFNAASLTQSMTLLLLQFLWMSSKQLETVNQKAGGSKNRYIALYLIAQTVLLSMYLGNTLAISMLRGELSESHQICSADQMCQDVVVLMVLEQGTMYRTKKNVVFTYAGDGRSILLPNNYSNPKTAWNTTLEILGLSHGGGVENKASNTKKDGR